MHKMSFMIYLLALTVGMLFFIGCELPIKPNLIEPNSINNQDQNVRTVYATTNLISNPGFENNKTGWIDIGNTTSTIVRTPVHSGAKAARCGTGDSGLGQYVNGITVGATYTLSGWICVNKAGDMAAFGVNFLDSNKTSLGKIEKYIVSTSYQKINISFIAPIGTTQVLVYSYHNQGPGYAYYDDISLSNIDAEGILPDVPARLRASVNGQMVTLRWDDAYGASSYKLYRDGALIGTATASTFSDFNLTAGSTHQYQISGVNKNGESAKSAPLNVIMVSDNSRVRAMWVWSEAQTVVSNLTERQNLLNYCQAKGINTLYMNFENYITTDPEGVKSFNAAAHALGIKVEALDGNMQWVYTENHHIALDRVQDVLTFNANCINENEKFDGIHHDNEPYTLPDWSTNQSDIALQYLNLCKESIDLINNSGSTISYAVDIPRWYDTLGLKVTYNKKTKYFYQHIIDLANYVALMDYQDIAAVIIDDGMNEVNYSATVGKKAVLGVETIGFTDGTPEQVTFYEEGETYMNGELADVREYYKGNAGFSGDAIHHYTTYCTMKP